DDKDAAGTFLEWMLQPENQKSLQLVLGSSSVATPTERTPEELEESPFLPEVDALTETSVPQVVLGHEARTPEIRSIVIEEVLRALAGEVDMQTAMDSAQERPTALVGCPGRLVGARRRRPASRTRPPTCHELRSTSMTNRNGAVPRSRGWRALAGSTAQGSRWTPYLFLAPA